MEVNQEVIDYYTRKEEDNRLCEFPGKVEFFRSREIILRFLPKGESAILDLGGGTGPYSFWLSDLGHSVHLVDPVKKHIELAKSKNRRTSSPITHISIGNALEIDFEEDSFDVVVLLGPMYHILEGAGRRRVLLNVIKCLKPDGMVFAAYISRFASLMDGFFDDLVVDPEFVTTSCLKMLLQACTNRREMLLRALRLTEREPSMMGMSSHGMVVGRKP